VTFDVSSVLVFIRDYRQCKNSGIINGEHKEQLKKREGELKQSIEKALNDATNVCLVFAHAIHLADTLNDDAWIQNFARRVKVVASSRCSEEENEDLQPLFEQYLGSD
jgi:hypothetical protein